jgi:hypothetical protein
MTRVKYFAVALLAAATLATPALARTNHVVHRKAMDAYASVSPDAAYYPNAGYYQGNGYYPQRSCVRAPDVGAFASDPWRAPPCEPNTGYDAYNYGW